MSASRLPSSSAPAEGFRSEYLLPCSSSSRRARSASNKSLYQPGFCSLFGSKRLENRWITSCWRREKQAGTQRGAKETEVTDLHKATGKHMLEKTVNELFSRERAVFEFVRLGNSKTCKIIQEVIRWLILSRLLVHLVGAN